MHRLRPWLFITSHAGHLRIGSSELVARGEHSTTHSTTNHGERGMLALRNSNDLVC